MVICWLILFMDLPMSPPPCENKCVALLLSTAVPLAPDINLSTIQSILLQMHEYLTHLGIDDTQC